ncbi:MAG: Chromophore lyase CpcS/CpeS [Chroococcopsis gigantea SAG 12.99]|jgi:hypothetical protein|nr:phycobiliprotein lyase [Chlorogloea purpurea SAG 13.99]MDV3001807.1 Chromophore lyase CpcS/CpeS [Chroococcopsis gigantea SAG 12.99]
MTHPQFKQFFDHCIGQWITERTYHYLTHQDVERSRTEFFINPLTPEIKTKVFNDNEYPLVPDLDPIPGFNLGFYTISDKGEEVSQNLNLLFVVNGETQDYLEGDYLRDKSYSEGKPIISHFRFDLAKNELLMTTKYTKVISVDSIRMINPSLRIRNIVNYQRPEEGEALTVVNLVGFGVEEKVVVVSG